MPDFEVQVEKFMYLRGTHSVSAATEEEARAIVRAMIESGALQSSEAKWGDPQYEDGTFDVVADDDEEDWGEDVIAPD